MLAATRKLKEWNKGKLCLATWSMQKKKEKKKKDVEYKSFFFLQGYMQHKWVHWLGLPHQSTNCCVSIHMGAMCAGLGGQTPRADKKRVQGLTWMCTSKEQSTLGCRANTSPILPFPLSLSSSRKKVGDIVTWPLSKLHCRYAEMMHASVQLCFISHFYILTWFFVHIYGCSSCFFLSSRPLSVPGECRCQCKVWQTRVVEVLPACFRDTRCAALVPRHHLYGIRGTSTGGSGIVTLLVLGIVIRRVLSKCRATLKTVTAGQGKISVVLV